MIFKYSDGYLPDFERFRFRSSVGKYKLSKNIYMSVYCNLHCKHAAFSILTGNFRNALTYVRLNILYIIFKIRAFFEATHVARFCVRVCILLTRGKHLHGRIISLKGQVYSYNTSLILLLLLRYLYQVRKVNSLVYVF